MKVANVVAAYIFPCGFVGVASWGHSRLQSPHLEIAFPLSSKAVRVSLAPVQFLRQSPFRSPH